MRETLARLFDLLRRRRLDAELAEELRFHREQLARDAQAAGASASDADWSARRRLGNVTHVVEDARARWSFPWLDRLHQDVRYALRGLRRSPGFALTVILTLGLGIGANAAMFGVIDRLMFRPFPYLRDPGSVDRVYLTFAAWGGGSAQPVFPYTRYLDLAKWTSSFSQSAAFVVASHGVGSGQGARERAVAGVTASFFAFFDARPALGRFLLAGEDETPRGADVAVVSFDYWNAELGRRDVIGEPLQVGDARYTIVGVAPDGFVGVAEGPAPAVYVPITAYAAHRGGDDGATYFVKYSWDWAQMMVRRKPGITRERATADLSTAMLRSWDASRQIHPGYGPADDVRPRAIAGALRTAAGPSPGLESRTIRWITGVAAIVLLIACANVANLLLARSLRRRREIALRLALGVSRRRLAAQTLTETLVLALLGLVSGIVLAQWGGVVLRRLFVADAAPFDVLTDWRTLLVSAAVALIAAVATGLAPVFFGGHGDVAATLKSGPREGTHQRSRARGALLVAQGALSVVLLVGAGLFVRSLDRVRQLQLGYDVDAVLLVQWEQRGTSIDSAAQVVLRRRLLEATRARTDVEHAAWTNSAPFATGTSTLLLEVPGIDDVSKLGRFTFQITSADYFATVQTRIRRGRGFTEGDRLGAPRVAVVSEAMAATLWPGRDAIGQCLRYTIWNIRADTMPCTTVVGVAENAVHDPIADLPMRYYLPETQLDFGARWLLLRMRRDPAVAGEEVRRALQALMPGQSLVTARPAHELLDAKRRSWLVGATMLVAFGGLALVVAAIGLYGVISYSVAQRMHELGVRIALGAQRRNVVALVVGQGGRFALVGLALGVIVALGGARWIQPLLFRQSATDPVVFVTVALLLLAAAVLASAVPAIRASRADPNTVLRAD